MFKMFKKHTIHSLVIEIVYIKKIFKIFNFNRLKQRDKRMSTTIDIDEYFQTNLTNNLASYLERTVNGNYFLHLNCKLKLNYIHSLERFD